MLISEILLLQAVLMVQRRTFTPMPSPLTVAAGEEVLENVPDPLTTLQLPVPLMGELALSVYVELQLLALAPALAVVGAALMFREYSSISPAA